MDEQLARQIGERVRFHRTAARQAKTVTAGLAGITPDYLYQLERGTKLPSIPVTMRLATAIGVPVAKLLGEQADPSKAMTTPVSGDAIYRALIGPMPALGEPRPMSELRVRITDAWRTWQTSSSRYTKLTRLLPLLISDTKVAVRASSSQDQHIAQCCAADLYGLVRTVAKRIGRMDLSLLAVDRAVHAAETANDPLRLAAARWNLTQVMLADNQAEGAEAVAMHGIEALKPETDSGDPDALALHGALLLIAAVAAARQGNAWTAYERLRLAEPLAARTGERNICWTVFGPTNVDMYRVSLAVETGQAAEGLRLAEQMDHDRSPSIERRVAFLLDQAKGYQQRRDFASCVVVLQAAEREAPEDLVWRPSAHSVVKAAMHGGRKSVAAEATRLATRVGMAV